MSTIIDSTVALLSASYCDIGDCREVRKRVTRSVASVGETLQQETCDHIFAFLAEDVIGCPGCGGLRAPEPLPESKG